VKPKLMGILLKTILSTQGMVIRCSPIIPDLKQAFFR
jgi:DNA replicative helicase MCM subunit Mcm2 (Cdc46/Mcm family)